MQPCNAQKKLADVGGWEVAPNVYLLKKLGATGQNGSSKQLLVILAETVSRGGQQPTLEEEEGGANSGKQLEPPCNKRDAFGLLATTTNDNFPHHCIKGDQ